MLDIEEERSAIRRWQEDGDRRALETLIRSHARLAWSVARRWTDNPTHLEDLVAAGMIGLVRAAERFDRTRDVRFATYSVWWVRNEITDALPHVRGVVDVPLRAASTSQAVTIVHGKLALDAAPEEDDIDILGNLPDAEAGPEERMLLQASENVMIYALTEALATLPPLEEKVIRARRLHETPTSPAELAAALGISAGRIRQVETRAMGLLQRHLLERGFNVAQLS
ncbi:RNA polymerase sigma-70 factor [Roseivivax halodurans JCM 10272]|uniref:RNA polymerase sigma-70 factor n=2 Tax=Roseivivax halodurans TaxID=93683 RepID=X7EK83_9RHOB|nr:RNA polymerase sigma-70 factor [Roseivivax halodurans JCM 10272]